MIQRGPNIVNAVPANERQTDEFIVSKTPTHNKSPPRAVGAHFFPQQERFFLCELNDLLVDYMQEISRSLKLCKTTK